MVIHAHANGKQIVSNVTCVSVRCGPVGGTAVEVMLGMQLHLPRCCGCQSGMGGRGYAASRPKTIALAVHGCEPRDAFEKLMPSQV